MDYYIDIKVLPDPEFTTPVLLNALYAKCHRIIGQEGNGEVGVSFPHHKKTLGDLLRLHGSQNQLTQLMEKNWLKGLGDYTHKSNILPIPSSVQYRTVARIQKKSPHNKRKRVIAKGWCTEAEALEKFKNEEQIELKLPYAQLKSLSKKTTIRLFIQHGELMKNSMTGKFSSYGLSRTATIPWF